MYLKQLLLFVVLLLNVLPLAAQPVISEFMAQNTAVLADEDGAFSDWVEIYNPGSGTLDLNGYYLTDDASNLTKWQFPTQVVEAGGFVVVFASGKNRAVAGSQLHASFALDVDGEYLALVATDGVTVVSSFGAEYPEQYPDISYGFQTHGTNPTLRAGQPGYLISHTPGAANSVVPGPHPLYCDTSLARIEITASQSVWNGLQSGTPTSVEGSVNVRFRHGDIDVTVTNVGISARGNTSLTKYPRSFNISFNSFVPGQDLFGIEKLNLNSESNDPSMARSKLAFDLAQAAGLPSEYANHVATVIIGPDNHRSGPDGVFFDAVLNNTQPVDDVFIKQRFANSRGNLYKCTYTAAGPANLTYKGPTGASYSGLSTYELKYQGGADGSFNDLAAFIDMINNTPGSSFASVIRKHFEVDDFLKRLALDVLTANWDGHWGNWNNFHLYRDPGNGKWHYIPYDLDNTFSIRWITPSSGDWAKQNIYTWGKSSSTPLVTRILGVTEFRNRYSYYMNQLLQTTFQNPSLNPLLYRIRENQTGALPFGGFGITNCKSTERSRYSGDWPNWTYTQYYDSFDHAQVGANGNVPNYYGITEFINARRTNALNQLNLVNIGPLISLLNVAPSLPATNESVTFSVRAEDDVQVNAVNLVYNLNAGGASTVAMLDNGAGADAVAGDRIYTAQIGPFAAGTLSYYVQATDNQGKSTFEPWGGAADTASLTIGSPLLNLAITELNYHPHTPAGSETVVSTNAEDYEFVEFQNLGASPLNLNGVRFVAGITYTFPSQMLAPGARIVIVKDLVAFSERYGGGINISGTYGGQLSNGGEELHLVDAGGATLHRFTYQDNAPWPERADGRGSSIELIDPASTYDAASNWRASIDHGGSPGAAGLSQTAGVVINEVLTHTDLPLVDSIELHNPTASAIDIGGWYLSDSSTVYKMFRIPSGTVLAAGGYLTFDETNHFNQSAGTNATDFALDAAHGDNVWLLQADAQSNLVAFVDHVSFGAAANAESFGRWPDGHGALYPMLTRTFGAANSGPRVGPVLIGEFMYQPASADPNLEFVEILNGGSLMENLTGWRLDGDVTFAFPTNTMLPPGEVLVVLPFNRHLPANAAKLAAFRSHYGIGTNAALTGAYLGSLPDAGGVLRLQRPDEPPAEEPAFTPLLLEDEVIFAPTQPWPEAAAGGGPALMRRGPSAWGNDPQSWTVTSVRLASPGDAPMADHDGDGLPDLYEIENYGSTNVVGSNPTGDTDGDGISDADEYIAGTSATNSNSRFLVNARALQDGNVLIDFETQAIAGPGYFGLDRRYELQQTTQLSVAGNWSIIPNYANLPATGEPVACTNSMTNVTWSVRGRVWLQ
ncbi:MAG TPA: lamin tail domain-containing protein [Verrucomicrobiota bacterium]|nr:lamin tail domain-containing protein [Verrucomicrobiota bacterium]